MENIKEWCCDLYGTCEPDNCRCQTFKLTLQNRAQLAKHIIDLRERAKKGKIMAIQELKEVWGMDQDYQPSDEGIDPKI